VKVLDGNVTNGQNVGKILTSRSSQGGRLYTVAWDTGLISHYHLEDLLGSGIKCSECFTFGEDLLVCKTCGKYVCPAHVFKKRGLHFCKQCYTGKKTYRRGQSRVRAEFTERTRNLTITQARAIQEERRAAGPNANPVPPIPEPPAQGGPIFTHIGNAFHTTINQDGTHIMDRDGTVRQPVDMDRIMREFNTEEDEEDEEFDDDEVFDEDEFDDDDEDGEL